MRSQIKTNCHQSRCANKAQMEKVIGPQVVPPPSYQEHPATLQTQTETPSSTHYTSTHSAFSSQPSVVLHSGPAQSSSPLATASFHSFSSATDIRLSLPTPPPNNRPQAYTLEKDSPFSLSFTFLPSTNALETFSWKNRSGPEIRPLDGGSHGKKCVRVSTGEVVAAWALPGGMSVSKRGKMAFLGDRGSLGEGFEVMCVICILAIVEKARRQKKSRGARGAAGAEAGGFLASGGAGGFAAGRGGGGC
jgi:hypothetical protein